MQAASRLAAAPMVRTNSGDCANRARHSASAGASPAGTRKPVSPSMICSGMPPTAVATTGVPQARASMTVVGKVSAFGRMKISVCRLITFGQRIAVVEEFDLRRPDLFGRR